MSTEQTPKQHHAANIARSEVYAEQGDDYWLQANSAPAAHVLATYLRDARASITLFRKDADSEPKKQDAELLRMMVRLRATMDSNVERAERVGLVRDQQHAAHEDLAAIVSDRIAAAWAALPEEE